MIFTSPLPDVTIPEVPLTDFVLDRAAEIPDRVAFIDGSNGHQLTYGEFATAVRRQAQGWLTDGLRPGEIVGILAPNCPEYAVMFHAVSLAGGVVTTINPTYTEREIHHQLNDSGATRLVAATACLPNAVAATAGTGVTEVLVIGEADGHRSLTSLDGEPLTDGPDRGWDDVVVLPYSSGTTGLSKGVILTNRNLVSNVVQSLGALKMGEGDAYVAVLPFFHIYGMQVLMNTGLIAGSTIVTLPRFDLEEYLRLHQDHGLTRAFVAPPIVVALAKHPLVDKFDLSALDSVFSGAAPLSAELALECGNRLGCEVVQGYGMTELGPVSHATPPGGFKPGSVGVALPQTEVMIVNPETGESQGEDVDGEVWVRGPQVMKGYLNDDAATAATLDSDGWLHTGDVGHMDSDGHLYVVDRLKELIKYKGFQVPPAELEALLLTHPKVADAAVIGIPDEEAGELPAGFVVLQPGAEATAAEIQEFVAGQTATYKHIRRITFVDAIPKSASGKILRRVLRDQPPA